MPHDRAVQPATSSRVCSCWTLNSQKLGHRGHTDQGHPKKHLEETSHKPLFAGKGRRSRCRYACAVAAFDWCNGPNTPRLTSVSKSSITLLREWVMETHHPASLRIETLRPARRNQEQQNYPWNNAEVPDKDFFHLDQILIGLQTRMARVPLGLRQERLPQVFHFKQSILCNLRVHGQLRHLCVLPWMRNPHPATQLERMFGEFFDL